MAFVHRSLKPSKVWAIGVVDKSCLNCWDTYLQNSAGWISWGKNKGGPIQSGHICSQSPFHLLQWVLGTPTLLWLLHAWLRNSCSMLCQLWIEFSGKLVYKLKATPSRDYTITVVKVLLWWQVPIDHRFSSWQKMSSISIPILDSIEYLEIEHHDVYQPI